MENFILKGNICYSKNKDEILTFPDSYLVCKEGKSAGVFKEIPEEYKSFPIVYEGDKLIMPGMTDLHIHAPQYAFRGTGMDMELLDWLQNQAFAEEVKYSDLKYADKAYSIFAEGLKNSATTHACIFATQHREATELLMEKMERSGLHTFVGKVNMDREAPDPLKEKDAFTSFDETEKWLSDIDGNFQNTRPMLTPRFLPSCTGELLEKLEGLRRKYSLPVQSHLSENLGEIELVKKLFPETKFYGEGYDNYSLFGVDKKTGESFKTIMAHCVYSTDEELELMKKNNVFIAHCPLSNTDLSSGIAPVRKYLDMGFHVGLGSDVAGGHTESIFASIVHAVEVSKLYWRLKDSSMRPLTFEEAFYMATKGGGEFFGRVGSFEEGFEFSAVVINDAKVPFSYEMDIRNRLERAVYLSMDLYALEDKYICTME